MPGPTPPTGIGDPGGGSKDRKPPPASSAEPAGPSSTGPTGPTNPGSLGPSNPGKTGQKPPRGADEIGTKPKIISKKKDQRRSVGLDQVMRVNMQDEDARRRRQENHNPACTGHEAGDANSWATLTK